MLMMAGASERHAPSFSKLRRPQELKKGTDVPLLSPAVPKRHGEQSWRGVPADSQWS